jgi:elongator complex protein 3
MSRTNFLARFDPEPYRSELIAIIRAIEALPDEDERAPLAAGELDRILKRHPRDGRGFFSRSQLLEGFRRFAASEGFALSEASFAKRVRLRPVRTLSGITPVTVFTKPHPCPGRCVFCPNDVRMPKSYLSDEPGAQRAADNDFDPYLQTWNRLAAYRAIGHATDKVELIVLGGTWSFHPEPYQRWYVARLFEALNDFGAGIDRRCEAEPGALDWSALPARIDGRRHASNPYNRLVRGFLEARDARSEDASWQALAALQRRNESAGSRCVGLVVETRPDQLTLEEVRRIRRLGATKVQLGIQSLDDAVLAANRRGHDVAATHRALRLLRAAGFKLQAHWMPNLLGSTPAADIADFARLFDDERVRPDELKVYPCSLVESAELVQHHERGEWRPYDYDELLEVIVAALGSAPRWCRLTRVIRDISSDDILVGNKLTNFREIAQAELERRGGVASDIRAREVRGRGVDPAALSLRETAYRVAGGQERFLELVTPDDRIAAFLRLLLPDPDRTQGEVLDEIAVSALIRELHVYGEAVPLGRRGEAAAQHRGLGRRLLGAAADRARGFGYRDLAVISAVGTRGYYRGRGFEAGELYQHRRL